MKTLHMFIFSTLFATSLMGRSAHCPVNNVIGLDILCKSLIFLCLIVL
jgi:hypothetical protein